MAEIKASILDPDEHYFRKKKNILQFLQKLNELTYHGTVAEPY